MSHIYQKSVSIYPGGEMWVPLNEAQVAEKAAEDRGINIGVTFWKNFSEALAGLRKPTTNADVQTSVDMLRYKPIIPTMIGMDLAPGGLDPKLRKPEEEEHHFEVPPTSPDFKHKRSEIFGLSRRYKEFTLTGHELRNLMNGCSRDGRAAERERHKVEGCPECKEMGISMKRRFEDAKAENDTRWEARMKRALNEQANELLSKKAKESRAAYADGQRDAAKQYAADKAKAVKQAYDDGRAEGLQAQAVQTTNDVLATYNRGLVQGRAEAKHEARRTSLRARDMLHMVMGLLRGDQPIAKGFLTSAIETLERM